MSNFFEYLGNLLQNMIFDTINFITSSTVLLFAGLGSVLFAVISFGTAGFDWQLGQVYFSEFRELLELFQPYQFLMDYYFGISILFDLVVDLTSLFLSFFFFTAYKTVMFWLIDLLMKWDICKI